jgi:DNA-binding transcriptional ArsR family regulator
MAAAALDLEEGAELLRALGHGVRLGLLKALIEGERSVGEIEAATGVGQPGLSQQLAILRKAELVTTRREAKLVYYSINRARLADLCALMEVFRGPVAHLAADTDRAESLRGAGGAAVFARVE